MTSRALQDPIGSGVRRPPHLAPTREPIDPLVQHALESIAPQGVLVGHRLITPGDEWAFKSDLASDATEEVTVSAYPSGSPSITYTRPPGAAVYPSASPNTAGDFSSTTLVKVKVKYTWNATFAQRQQSEEAETLIAAGTKK